MAVVMDIFSEGVYKNEEYRNIERKIIRMKPKKLYRNVAMDTLRIRIQRNARQFVCTVALLVLAHHRIIVLVTMDTKKNQINETSELNPIPLRGEEKDR